MTKSLIASALIALTVPTALAHQAGDGHGPACTPAFQSKSASKPRIGPMVRRERQVPRVFGSGIVGKIKADRNSLATLSRLRSKTTGSKTNRIGKDSLEKLLVVYDYWGEYKFMGELYGRQMKEILSHFGWEVDLVATHQYQAGMIGSHRATVYVGALFDTEIPQAMKDDVMAATKPVAWTGYNLWKLARNADWSYNKPFETKFGIRYNQIEDQFNAVNYKSTLLDKQDPFGINYRVLSSAKATVLARQRRPDATTAPYILKAGNLFVVGDNPIASVQYSYVNGHDRTLAFCDVLHDVVGSGITTNNHRAVVRIEDVGATADPAKLREIADILSTENVPFVVSTIPFYRDPLGYWNGGVPYEMTMDNASQVLDALQYMKSKGGKILMHGYTHQYNDVPNPRYGVSGDDWEFFRAVINGNGDTEFWGPVWEDSTEWVANRITEGKSILDLAGLGNPDGWITPHYLASATDYAYFATAFDYNLCPTITYTTDSAGFLYFSSVFAPYTTKDEYGSVHIPETLSYISPETNMSAQQIINRAKDMKVVRDGWAGMFFHPFLDTAWLRTAVRGVKAQGFTFVHPSKAFAPTPR